MPSCNLYYCNLTHDLKRLQFALAKATANLVHFGHNKQTHKKYWSDRGGTDYLKMFQEECGSKCEIWNLTPLTQSRLHKPEGHSFFSDNALTNKYWKTKTQHYTKRHEGRRLRSLLFDNDTQVQPDIKLSLLTLCCT